MNLWAEWQPNKHVWKLDYSQPIARFHLWPMIQGYIFGIQISYASAVQRRWFHISEETGLGDTAILN